METRPIASAPQPARLAATLALGLGLGPMLGLLAPWSLAALAGCAAGALLLGPLAGRAEARAAESGADGVPLHGAWTASLCVLEAALGSLAILHALNLAALAGAGLLATVGGQPVESGWSGAPLAAPPGWLVFPGPLAAWLLSALVAAWMAHLRGVESAAARLAGVALVGQVALALRGLSDGTDVAPALLDAPGAWPQVAGAMALGGGSRWVSTHPLRAMPSHSSRNPASPAADSV